MANSALTGAGQKPFGVGGGTGGGPDIVAPAAGAGDNSKPPIRRKKPNHITIVGGSREMKGYPVTGDELLTLGIVQGGSAVCFALAGSTFGFWLSTKQAIDLTASDVALVAERARWEAYGDAGGYASVFLAIAGLVLFGISGFRARRIMKNTNHG